MTPLIYLEESQHVLKISTGNEDINWERINSSPMKTQLTNENDQDCQDNNKKQRAGENKDKKQTDYAIIFIPYCNRKEPTVFYMGGSFDDAYEWLKVQLDNNDQYLKTKHVRKDVMKMFAAQLTSEEVPGSVAKITHMYDGDWSEAFTQFGDGWIYTSVLTGRIALVSFPKGLHYNHVTSVCGAFHNHMI